MMLLTVTAVGPVVYVTGTDSPGGYERRVAVAELTGDPGAFVAEVTFESGSVPPVTVTGPTWAVVHAAIVRAVETATEGDVSGGTGGE